MVCSLRSFKLQFDEGHARIVPATDATGCPFAGPGVSLRGEPFGVIAKLAGPMVAAMQEFEPGIVVRSLSLDLTSRRLLATVWPVDSKALEGGEAPASPRGSGMGPVRPRVVRVDDGHVFERVCQAARPLIAHLERAAVEALARRSPRDEGDPSR